MKDKMLLTLLTLLIVAAAFLGCGGSSGGGSYASSSDSNSYSSSSTSNSDSNSSQSYLKPTKFPECPGRAVGKVNNEDECRSLCGYARTCIHSETKMCYCNYD